MEDTMRYEINDPLPLRLGPPHRPAPPKPTPAPPRKDDWTKATKGDFRDVVKVGIMPFPQSLLGEFDTVAAFNAAYCIDPTGERAANKMGEEDQRRLVAMYKLERLMKAPRVPVSLPQPPKASPEESDAHWLEVAQKRAAAIRASCRASTEEVIAREVRAAAIYHAAFSTSPLSARFAPKVSSTAPPTKTG